MLDTNHSKDSSPTHRVLPDCLSAPKEQLNTGIVQRNLN